MYTLSRLMLMLAVALAVYSVVLAAALTAPWGLVVLVLCMAVIAKKKYAQLTAFGTARWASPDDLRRVGMLDAKGGLILGRVSGKPPFLSGVKTLFSRRLRAKDACRQFLLPLSGRRLKAEASLVRLPQAIHTAVFAPTGVGKNVSLISPFLLTSEASCCLVDFKGELASLTAEHRRRMGHEIVVLDPFNAVASKLRIKSATFNPLDFIDKDSPLAIDECNDLAKALAVRTGEEKEPHWVDSAEAFIAGITATVVQYGNQAKGNRSLQTVREILANPEKLDMSIKVMCESGAWGGMLARLGGQLTYFVEKEKSSTLTTTGRFLRFLDTLAVAESTKASSFDPARLRRGKMTVYLVLPPEHMRAQSPLLRMWIGSMLQAVVRGGLQQTRKVHFVLDEAASLGRLEALEDAVDKFRGYGVRLQFYYQSLGQLKKCWPEGQDQTLLSNTTQVFFGVNDPQTAEYVSARLGEETIVVESGGSGTGSSSQHTSGASQSSASSGYSRNNNRNWQQMGKKLLRLEQVIALSPRIAICLTPDVPPVWTTLVRYFEEKSLWKRRGWLRAVSDACRVFIVACLFLFLAACCAALLTAATMERLRQEAKSMPSQAWHP